MTKAEKEKYKDSAFIYSLEYPEGNVRYIGKTIDPKRRLSGHLYPNVNEKGGRKGNWIKSLKKKGVRPIMNIIDIVSRENANFWEIHYISLFKSFGKEEYDSNPLILNEKICKAKRSPKVQKYL